MKRLVGSLVLVSGLLAAGVAQATNYAIHLGGMCSKNWGATSFSSNLTESNARNSYVHDAGYNGTTVIYRLGGNKHFLSGASCVVGTLVNFLTFNFSSTCLQSMNDGAVAYHSSGGYQNVGDNQY